MSTTWLFWDIDGTLLSTGRAGMFAWEDAVRDVLESDIDVFAMQTSGLTDAEIAQKLAREAGRDDPAIAAKVLRHYEQRVPERLGMRKGKVMPNVREILESLRGREDVVSMLLTGNVEAGARAKLRHYGLAEFFESGAFCVEASGRPSIAARAREMAEEQAGKAPDGERMYVIGDTPYDISCGKAIGARTVAVASGSGYALAELAAHEPWLALDALPAPAQFAHLLGLDGS